MRGIRRRPGPEQCLVRRSSPRDRRWSCQACSPLQRPWRGRRGEYRKKARLPWRPATTFDGNAEDEEALSCVGKSCCAKKTAHLQRVSHCLLGCTIFWPSPTFTVYSERVRYSLNEPYSQLTSFLTSCFD